MPFIDPRAYGWRENQPEYLPDQPAPQAAIELMYQIVDNVYGAALLTGKVALDSTPYEGEGYAVRVVALHESAVGTDSRNGGWFDLTLTTLPEVSFRLWGSLQPNQLAGADKYRPYVHQSNDPEHTPITVAEAASILMVLPADSEPILQKTTDNSSEQAPRGRIQRAARSIKKLLFGT